MKLASHELHDLTELAMGSITQSGVWQDSFNRLRTQS
ncbi:hypothetical protein SAMN05192559_12017 [Halobacillus karajensis]|nr:hypothetical protein SAMN05192559_12017 [Halobacillus karajensis]